MSTPTLAGYQRKHLRGLAHRLKPLVQVGESGLSTAVIAATDRALEDHVEDRMSVSGGCES